MRAYVIGAFGFRLFVKNIAFLHRDILAQRRGETLNEKRRGDE
jgi:hypothetical protein